MKNIQIDYTDRVCTVFLLAVPAGHGDTKGEKRESACMKERSPRWVPHYCLRPPSNVIHRQNITAGESSPQSIHF